MSYLFSFYIETENDAKTILNNGISNHFIPLIHSPDSNIQYIGATLIGVLAQVISTNELLVDIGKTGVISGLVSKMKTSDEKLQTAIFSALQNLTYKCKENASQLDLNTLEYIVLCIKLKTVEIQDSCVWICIHLALEDIKVDEIKSLIQKHKVIDFFEVLTHSPDQSTRLEAIIAYNKYK